MFVKFTIYSQSQPLKTYMHEYYRSTHLQDAYRDTFTRCVIQTSFVRDTSKDVSAL